MARRKGEECINAKLTNEQVSCIYRRTRRVACEKTNHLAEEFNVSAKIISAIKWRRIWLSVTSPIDEELKQNKE